MSATEGPWMVNKYGSIGAGESGVRPIIASVEPFYGAERKYGDHADNARLIAAAPELLKALKEAREALDTVDHNGQSGLTVIRRGRPIEQIIDAAIAKAVGKLPED